MNADDILDQLEDLMDQGQVTVNQVSRLRNVVQQQSASAPKLTPEPKTGMQPVAKPSAAPTTKPTGISNPGLAAKQAAAVDAARSSMTAKQPATPEPETGMQPVAKPNAVSTDKRAALFRPPVSNPSNNQSDIEADRDRLIGNFGESKIYSKFLGMNI